jgi:DNA repair ATPase RecN
MEDEVIGTEVESQDTAFDLDGNAVEGGVGYTAEDLAAIRAANGVTSETGDGAEVADVSTDEVVSDDPWAWAADIDPSKVQKSWQNYTKTMQELKPYKELAEEIQSNPALQAHLRAFYEQPRGAEDELLNLKTEVQSLRQEQSVKEEYSELTQYLEDEKLPPVEFKTIVQYAGENKSPNLQTAYRDMMFDEIRNSTRDNTLAEVQKTRGAAIPNINAGTKVTTGLTQREIDNMSNEEFEKRYQEVQEFYGGKR